MATKEYNVDLDIKGKVSATSVPNSTGSIVTWNASTKVFGLRTNAQIISDLGLQGGLTSGLHTILNGNKVDVKFDVGTFAQDKSNKDRLLFGNTTSTDVVIKGAVTNGDFKIKDSTDADLFRINGANKVPYFPQLPAPQSGASNSLAIFDSGNGLWKSNLTIGDLVTTSNISGYIPAAQNLSLGTVTGQINISGGTSAVLTNLNNSYQRQDANVRELRGGFQTYLTVAGNSNYPTAGVGTGIRIERYSNATNQLGFDMFTHGATSVVYLKTFAGSASEGAWETIATREYANQNYHKIAKTLAEATSAGYYVNYNSDVNNILGNISAYAASANAGGTAITNGHVVSFGRDALYGFQLYQPVLADRPLEIRHRVNGIWTNEQVAYRSWVTQQISNAGANYITTNTTQTGLSGNKTTSGNWTANSYISSRLGYFGTYDQSQTQGIWSMDVAYSTSASTTTLGNQYGLAYSNISVGGSSLASRHQIHFAHNGTAVVTVDMSGQQVRANNGFIKVGQDNTQMLLAGGGHRPVSDFALVSSIPAQVNITQGAGITVSGTYPNITITNSAPNATHTGDVTGSTALTIATNAVTNSKMAQMPTMTIKGNASVGTANPVDLTPSQVLTMLGVQAGANNYTHPNHTGDVTSVGDGATTIVANAVTFTKMQNIATQTFLGRATTGTGNVEALTVAQMQTLLGFSTQTLSNSTSNLIVSNTVQRAALTGDVTAAQNSNATTIANSAVTNAKMANMAANTFKGRLSTAGAPQDLTVAQMVTALGVTNTTVGANNTNYTSGAINFVGINGVGVGKSGNTITIAGSGSGSGITNLSTDDTNMPGPTASNTPIYFHSHVAYGRPITNIDDEIPGNMEMVVESSDTVRFYGSYDNTYIEVIDAGKTYDIDIDGLRKHIYNIVFSNVGSGTSTVKFGNGLYSGDQINITAPQGQGIAIQSTSTLVTPYGVGAIFECTTHANFIWADAEQSWILVGYN